MNNEHWRPGRLAQCDLIFPNIEMRLGIGTIKGKWVNIHLLVNPDERNHLQELRRFLPRLTFKTDDDTYSCSPEDLIHLGQRFDPSLTDIKAALRCGSEQFKVNFDILRDNYKDSSWAKQNIVIAVAGSETDGTSGVRDSADATLRREVEKFAHIIFASSPTQRDFWLGHRTLSAADIRQRYRSLKPCVHGSDAHELRTVGAPAGGRYSWIKGIPAFDTLWQACFDPANRAFIGESPPVRATPSQVITSVEITNAPWMLTPLVQLNPGLIAVIGARGSGKTALADIIAYGCGATSIGTSGQAAANAQTSFLQRAHELLTGASVTLQWEGGEQINRNLDGTDDRFAAEYPRARYLSQKFVEELCSAAGMTDELLQEIERVVFEAHPVSDRDGAVGFEELRDQRTMRFREARAREEEALSDASERIGTELEKIKLVAVLKKQVEEKAKSIERYSHDRSKLVARGTPECPIGALSGSENTRS